MHVNRPKFNHRLKSKERSLLLEVFADGRTVGSFDGAPVVVQRAVDQLNLKGYIHKTDAGWSITTLGRLAINHQHGLVATRLLKRTGKQ